MSTPNRQLDEGVACRAVCLADCADSDRIHLRSAPKLKPSIELTPRTQQLAPKEFQAQILAGKRTRNGRHVLGEPEHEEEEEEMAKQEVPFLNDLRLAHSATIISEVYVPSSTRAHIQTGFMFGQIYTLTLLVSSCA